MPTEHFRRLVRIGVYFGLLVILGVLGLFGGLLTNAVYPYEMAEFIEYVAQDTTRQESLRHRAIDSLQVTSTARLILLAVKVAPMIILGSLGLWEVSRLRRTKVEPETEQSRPNTVSPLRE